MVHHIPIIAVLTIVQGILEVLMGLLLLAASAFAPQLVSMFKDLPGNPNEFAGIASLVYLIMGAPTLIAGVLHIVAGIRNFSFRNRILGITSLIFGAGSIASCYCAPTGIGLMIYGLVVYMNHDVVDAFDLAKQGCRPDEIRRMAATGDLPSPRRDLWDEYSD